MIANSRIQNLFHNIKTLCKDANLYLKHAGLDITISFDKKSYSIEENEILLKVIGRGEHEIHNKEEIVNVRDISDIVDEWAGLILEEQEQIEFKLFCESLSNGIHVFVDRERAHHWSDCWGLVYQDGEELGLYFSCPGDAWDHASQL